jgi:hypothetical protein
MASRPTPKRRKSSPGSARGTRSSARAAHDVHPPADPLSEVPGLVRRARAKVAEAPETLRHLADLLEGGIHEFANDDEPRRLEAASVQILGAAVGAAAIILDLAVFAGGLAELARVVAVAETQ